MRFTLTVTRRRRDDGLDTRPEWFSVTIDETRAILSPGLEPDEVAAWLVGRVWGKMDDDDDPRSWESKFAELQVCGPYFNIPAGAVDARCMPLLTTVPDRDGIRIALDLGGSTMTWSGLVMHKGLLKNLWPEFDPVLATAVHVSEADKEISERAAAILMGLALKPEGVTPMLRMAGSESITVIQARLAAWLLLSPPAKTNWYMSDLPQTIDAALNFLLHHGNLRSARPSPGLNAKNQRFLPGPLAPFHRLSEFFGSHSTALVAASDEAVLGCLALLISNPAHERQAHGIRRALPDVQELTAHQRALGAALMSGLR